MSIGIKNKKENEGKGYERGWGWVKGYFICVSKGRFCCGGDMIVDI